MGTEGLAKMRVWVDADACPVVIRDVLCRAAGRTEVLVTFVSNHYIRLPPSRSIKFIQVAHGFDVADIEIVKRLGAGDLVITSDIPLAAEVIEKKGYALNFRGELYTANNIKECLNIRDFMDTLRSSGIDTGGLGALTQNERQSFVNHLDKFLNKHLKNRE